MADEVIRQTMANHAKPDGSVNSFAPTTGQHFLAARQAGIGATSLQNFILRGKPLEAFGSMAGINTPLVVITQDSEADHNPHNQNKAGTPGGVASDANYGVDQNSSADSVIALPDISIGTAEVTIVNNDSVVAPSNEHGAAMQSQDKQHVGIANDTFGLPHKAVNAQTSAVNTPLSDMVTGLAQLSNVVNGTAEVKSVNMAVPSFTPTIPAQDASMAFYQQQIMLNHQIFLQQQQTVNALIGKVDTLTNIVTNREQSLRSSDENTRVEQLPKVAASNVKTHAMSDSNLEDVSSESENGDTDSHGYESDNEHNQEEVKNNEKQSEVSENMKMLQELGKELGKKEAVGQKVDETLSEVVNIGIRSQIDRNLAKKLCNDYQRPENCHALVVPKINKELWNTTTIAKASKETDKLYQTAQRYLNQGIIPLVQLIENLLKGNGAENNFKLARDSLQLLAYAHRDISNLRRIRLKSVVAEKYRPLCNESSVLTENLLGDELEKQIKTMDEMRKVGNNIAKYKSEKRKRKHQEDRPSKYTKYSGYNSYSGHKKDRSSFLDKKTRYSKPSHQKNNKKNHKQ